MTREELIESLDEQWSYTIDSYYRGLNDDWIKEVLIPYLDDFESRTCGNCKWFNVLDYNKNYGRCKSRILTVHNKQVPKDFGCNKWEARDE